MEKVERVEIPTPLEEEANRQIKQNLKYQQMIQLSGITGLAIGLIVANRTGGGALRYVGFGLLGGAVMGYGAFMVVARIKANEMYPTSS
jgi:hypothetical protein